MVYTSKSLNPSKSPYSIDNTALAPAWIAPQPLHPLPLHPQPTGFLQVSAPNMSEKQNRVLGKQWISHDFPGEDRKKSSPHIQKSSKISSGTSLEHPFWSNTSTPRTLPSHRVASSSSTTKPNLGLKQ